MQDAWSRRHLLRAVRPDRLQINQEYLLVRIYDVATTTYEDTFLGIVKVVNLSAPDRLADFEHRHALLLSMVEVASTPWPDLYSLPHWFSTFANDNGTTFPIQFRFYAYPLRRDELLVAQEIISVLVGSPPPHVHEYSDELPSTRECFLALH